MRRQYKYMTIPSQDNINMKYVDDKYYHVYNRGAHKGRLFLNDNHFEYCLRLIKKYQAIYSVSIAAYCLMPNHYHLLVRQNVGGSVSRFIQTLFNAYSQGFNKITSHSGTLFQGRAKKIIVDSDEYAVQLIRYIHLNPVEAKLVQSPDLWKYSDYLVWTDEIQSDITDLTLRDGYFKDGNRYRTFVPSYSEPNSIEKYLLEG